MAEIDEVANEDMQQIGEDYQTLMDSYNEIQWKIRILENGRGMTCQELSNQLREAKDLQSAVGMYIQNLERYLKGRSTKEDE